MEALGIVILSVFSLYGIYLSISEALRIRKNKSYDAGFRMILAVPRDGRENLEGIVREIFRDEIPDRLLSDQKLYLAVPEEETEIGKIVDALKGMYPLEVLPDSDPYCIITDRNTD